MSDVPRRITGTLLAPDGQPITNRTLSWYRASRRTVAQGGSVIVDEVFRSATNALGEVDVSVVPGAYLVMVRLADEDRYFEVGVPEGTGPAQIQDLVDTAAPVITPPQLAQAQAARDDAIAAKELAETARDKAQDWAEKPTAPGGSGTKSAKTWATEASGSAGAALADRVQTGEDRVQTGLDRAATGEDRVQTGLDRVATGEDRTQTGLDRTAAQNARNKAQDWAEKATAPGGSGTKSAKTWAAEASGSAGAASTAKDEAEAARNLAHDWAEKATAPGGAGTKSAKTWAAEVAAAVGTANGMPLGTIMHFAAHTPPDGWLVCDGTAVTALYPDLRAFLVDAGSPYGVSGADPLLPDLRGEFVRGWDGGRGVDAGRVFGTAQGDAIRNITGTFDPGGRVNGASEADFTGPFTRGTASRTSNGNASSDSRVITFDASKVVPTASENRPRNVALLPCIRAYASVVNVPGQADLDNILQQTQVQVDDAMDRVVGEAETAAVDRVAWKRVGKVPVGTGAAVTLTGLDLTKETLFILSYVKCSSTSNQTLRIRASEDGGATWLTAPSSITASANWSGSILRGALELFPDPGENRIITSLNTAAAVGGNQYNYAPVELVAGTAVVLLPSCDTIVFAWSGGNFAPSGAVVAETDCIIIYQRG